MRRSVCVCNPWNHRDPVGLFSLLSLCCTAGECGVIVGPHSTKLPQSRDTESDQLGVPASFLFLKWHEAKPRTSSCRHARNAVNLSSRRFVAFNYRNSGPLHLVFSGFGSLRPACGTAFSSVHNILSVFGLVPTRDEPAECLPWTRRTGVRRYLPCPEMYVSAADSSWLML